MTAQKGFTLVEIMVSVLILGIGLTIVANSYMAALKGINSTANIIEALNLIGEKFDAFEVANLKSGLPVSDEDDVLKSFNKSYDYKLRVIELTQPKLLADSLVQACFSLSWQEQKATKNVTLSTYLPKPKHQIP